MGKKALNLIGQKYGRLLVLERAASKKDGNKVLSMWLCQCDCGNKTVVAGYRLKNGVTKSCGCLQRERASEVRKTHGQWKTPLYKVWNSMRQRCENPNVKTYRLYGAEGKTVCEEWQTFEGFYLWAIKTGYQDGLTIERKDSTKGYSPENCKWATKKEQANNTRRNHYMTYHGKTQTLTQWSEELHIPIATIYWRLNRGWNTEKILSTPVKSRGD